MNINDYVEQIKEAVETFAWEFRKNYTLNDLSYEVYHLSEEEWDKVFTRWLKDNPHQGYHG